MTILEKLEDEKLPRRPAPAFQNYASDDMGDEAYRTSSLEERGLLLSIRNYCWVNGSVPTNHHQMARLLDVPPDALSRISGALIKKFVSVHPEDSNRLYVPDLARQQKEFAERHKKLSAAGKRGGMLTQAGARSARAVKDSFSQASGQASKVGQASEKRRVETRREEEGDQRKDYSDWGDDSFSDLD